MTESDGSVTTTVEASTSEGDPCMDVDCPPGEHCVEGNCFSCIETPSCADCSGPEACQCPEDDPCCEIGVCIAPDCNPLLQDCAQDMACYPLRDGWGCASDASGPMGVYGDPCEYINACDPGLVCLNATAVPGCMGAVGCCSTLCDTTNPIGDAQCPGAGGGQMCTPWYEPGTAPMGLESLGVCALP